ncbi:MAG: NADH-quinone oxidoreductase subunit G [Kineosporiaceae bacterium]|nr:NADH-quinone oxidoreductase subunit G [Kineosporiaceae bacterium]
MTVTANPPAGAGSSGQPPADLVTLTIDDTEISVAKGTLIIRAAEQLGIAIPRFCDHPLLAPAGACRQCLVEVAMPGPDGTPRPMPKPQASCAMECTNGMVVRTQKTSPVAEKAQRGIMEFLLVNHPLDCPVCDKGGECPLQNQALANGRSESRFVDVKRTFPKPIRISTQVLLDRERCILCQRCTRFSKEIAGDPFIDLQMRGANQQIGTFSPDVLGFRAGAGTVGAAATTESGQPFASYFSGNTVQICPVGALTGAAYRFRARPFDLVSTPGVCEHCASGCALRVDHRRNAVTRRLALEDPAVNEDWNCDKGRWAFTWTTAPDRIEYPMVRDAQTGELRVASWPEALDVAARGLAAAAANGGVGVLPGGRVSVEDAYAYAKFARVAVHTNDIDMRARPHSAEEAHFLAHAVAGRAMGPTYRELEAAPAVLLLALEPEEESPIVFLRLRKAATTRPGAKLAVYSVAPWESRGLTKLGGRLLMSAPGTETEVISAIATPGPGAPDVVSEASQALRSMGAVILVGERLAAVPGALTAALDLAKATGARLAWVPRRAGERGAIEAGAMPNLLPGGRPVNDPTARVDLAAAWDVPGLPSAVGRDASGIVAAAARGELAGLLVGGVDPRDLPRPDLARKALDTVGFLVSLEVRSSEVTQRADVVLPVAPITQKAGTFVNWEGRWRPFERALPGAALSDFRVLDMLADAMDTPLGLRSVEQVRGEFGAIEAWDGLHAPSPVVHPAAPPAPAAGTAALATWPMLLDAGRLQDGEAHLAGTAHRAVARMSAATAAENGLGDGDDVTVSTDAGWVTVPVVVTEMPDRVVWLPTNSPGCTVRADLGVDAGAVVSIRATGSNAGTGEHA